MANYHVKSIRWVRSKHGHGEMPVQQLTVASNYGTAINVGDPIKLATDGTGQQAAAGNSIYGVCVSIVRYWDAANNRMTFTNGPLPANTVWGSNWQKRSVIAVVPVEGQIFRMDCNDNTTATTESAYEAFIGENADMAVSSGDWTLNISTHATTNTLGWRIVDLINRPITDFTALYVPLLVEANLSQLVPYTTTGT